MSDSELRNYVANQTIANLTNLGYMDGVDLEEFKNILLGVTPIDFNIIDKINRNAEIRTVTDFGVLLMT